TSVLSLSSLLIAILTFAAILILAWKHGRTWCNTICPVGTVLGFLSRYSLFKVRIDTAKCNGCGLCATKCKAACI
ncbi:4Fe-4S binding protein, partial [Vibrio cholerae O1]|nr:4Fe-4S binding protein [Vibrio cholerae O1]